jgi:hypothetical protein
MIEEKMNGAMCSCNTMHGMRGGRYFAKRILGIIVLLVVFWFGTELGELRTLMRYSHESHEMMGWNGDQYGDNMMYDTTDTLPTAPAVPAVK